MKKLLEPSLSKYSVLRYNRDVLDHLDNSNPVYNIMLKYKDLGVDDSQSPSNLKTVLDLFNTKSTELDAIVAEIDEINNVGRKYKIFDSTPSYIWRSSEYAKDIAMYIRAMDTI